MSKPEAIQYVLKDVVVTTYRSNLPPPNYEGEVIPLNFNTSCTTGIATDFSHIRIMISVTVTPINDRETELIYIETASLFPCLNLQDWEIDGAMDLPKELWGSLITTAVGTTRGILLANTGSSQFGKIIMPIVNTENLIPKEKFKRQSDEENPIATYSHAPQALRPSE